MSLPARPAESVLLRAFAEQVLASYAAARRSPRTIKTLRRVLAELVETVGPDPGRDATVADLTTAGVARWMARKCPQRGPNTVIGLLGYIRAVCSYAAEEGLLDRPPAWRRIRPRPVRARPVRHHSARQVALLLDHLEAASRRGWKEHRTYVLVATVAYTGLRRDEALWLRRRDLHLDEGYLDVEPHHRRGLKTEESAQPVPVPGECRPILEAWLPEIPPAKEWVFPALRGDGPWYGGGPGRRPIDALQAAGQAVGIEGLTWQSLRRSWATHAESRWGCTDAEIQRVLRHASPQTSRRHYREADVENLRRIGARVSYRSSA
jgi:integrase